MKKELSIIIPCYNVAPYLPSTLDSILIEQGKNIDRFEILLINDGSKDNTLQVIKEYQKKYPNTIKYFDIENHGVGYARNIGIENSTGDYIYFIDGDDTIQKNVLNEWLDFTIKNTLDISFGGFQEKLESTNKISRINQNVYNGIHKGSEVLSDKLLKNIWICTGNAIYRSDLIKQNGIRYTLNKYGEDAEFIGKCLVCSTKAASINKIVLSIMVRRNSAMSSMSFSTYKDAISSCLNLKKFVESKNERLENEFAFEYLNLYLTLVKSLFLENKNYSKKEFKRMEEFEKPRIVKSISFNKRMEYFLLKSFPWLYFLIVKFYYRKK